MRPFSDEIRSDLGGAEALGRGHRGPRRDIQAKERKQSFQTPERRNLCMPGAKNMEPGEKSDCRQLRHKPRTGTVFKEVSARCGVETSTAVFTNSVASTHDSPTYEGGTEEARKRTRVEILVAARFGSKLRPPRTQGQKHVTSITPATSTAGLEIPVESAAGDISRAPRTVFSHPSLPSGAR